MKPKMITALLAVLLLLLGGCSPSLREHSQTAPTSVSKTEPTIPVQTLPAETLAPAQPIPPVTEPPPTTEPGLMMITDAIGLRDYLRVQEEMGSTDFSFRYTSTTVDASAQNIARVGGYFYVETRVDGDLCTVHVLDYPGERMVDAWRREDESQLTEPERQALQIAQELVSQASAGASSELEREQALFDLFRAHVSYNDGSTDIPDPMSPPRHLTAVGALVDGSANCQGYADGFYVLASLAGLRVERMHVDIPEGGHTVNVVCLDGAWYVVDTTYNDLNDPSGTQISYSLMNVGRDRCVRYSWHKNVERYPIAEQTDHHFYYYLPGSNRSFSSVEAMAQRIIDDWRVYGRKEYYMLLEGQITGWQELQTALETVAADYGLEIICEIWYEQQVEDTYFYISLN